MGKVYFRKHDDEIEGINYVEDRSLSRPIGSDKGKNLTSPHMKRKLMDGL